MSFNGGPSSSARRPIKPAGAGKVKAPRKHNEAISQNLDRLAIAIEQIQLHNASKLSFEEHYRYAYNLVLHKNGHQLYNKVAELVTKHLEKEACERVVPLFPSTSATTTSTQASTSQHGRNTDDVALAAAAQLFLDRLREVWDDHIACMSKLRDVLKYMDKVYTASSQLPSVWDLGLALFFHKVILYSTATTNSVDIQSATQPVSSKSAGKAKVVDTKPTDDPNTIAHHLIKTLLAVVRIERDGETISRHSIASAVEILSELVDEGLIPLPIQGSQGMGSGAPVLPYASSGALARSKPVMGDGPPGERDSPYRTSFEKILLQQTSDYYERESRQLLIDCDAPTFLRKIEKRLEEETNRAQTYLAPSTEPLLVSLLEDRLINAHLTSVIEHQASGLSSLVRDSRIDDLKRMYRLFGRVGRGHPALQAGLSAWIATTGKAINEGLLLADVNDDAGKGKGTEGKAAESGNAKTRGALSWVQNVLDLKDKTDTLLREAFDLNLAFEKSINDAFSDFVNANKKSPEYISLFIDENLKKGLKGKSEAEVDDVLNRSVSLFRFLVEKDTFERYYNSHLAKRLIGQRSVSDDAERNMLAKFKVEAGAAFAKAAEGMMKDVKVSEDMLAEYRRHQDRQPVKAPFDMITTVCGSNFWPFATKEKSCKLPPTLLKGIEAFEKFYNTKHSGRKLTFKPELGTVEVKVRFAARSHDITLSTHAMIVLLLFETLGPNDTLTYDDIATATEMPSAELKRTLQSVACAKYKVLTKIPKGRDVNETDRFAFNDAFTCPLAKIKIQMIVSKVESSEERSETNEKIEEQRMAVCEAAVVRIMKDRKVLQHSDLLNLVIAQISRFNPSPQLIKRAIERMIEKEYLERDENDRKALRYLA